MRRLAIATILAGIASAAIAQEPIGSWAWTSTDLGGGTVETPATVGYTVQLQLHEDYRAVKLVDNIWAEESTWEVAYVWVGPVHMPVYSTGLGGGCSMEHNPGQYLYLESYPEFGFRREAYSFVGVIPVVETTFGSVKALYRAGLVGK